ncbi:MAG: DUF1189 domain-containing protein [Bacillota bacterium]|nr:DUF1189 domain-containing protein [Bacillota bacterium]
MEEKMSIISQFMNSISNIKAYRYFFRHSTAKAVLYLVLISVFFAGLSGMQIFRDVNSGVDTFKSHFEADFPSFLFENGELTVDAEMPYLVKQSAEEIFVIDTFGRMDQSVLDDYENGIFISKHYAVHKENRFQTRHFDFKSLEGAAFSKEDVITWIPLLKWLNLFIIVFGFIFFVLGKLISAFMVSLVGLIIERITNFRIGLGNLFKLSIYALTFPILLKTLFGLLGLNFPYFWALYYGLALFYLSKAVQMIRG